MSRQMRLVAVLCKVAANREQILDAHRAYFEGWVEQRLAASFIGPKQPATPAAERQED